MSNEAPGLVRDTPSQWAAERIKEALRNYHTVRFQHRRGILIAAYYTYDGKVHIHDREFVL